MPDWFLISLCQYNLLMLPLCYRTLEFICPNTPSFSYTVNSSDCVALCSLPINLNVLVLSCNKMKTQLSNQQKMSIYHIGKTNPLPNLFPSCRSYSFLSSMVSYTPICSIFQIVASRTCGENIL